MFFFQVPTEVRTSRVVPLTHVTFILAATSWHWIQGK